MVQENDEKLQIIQKNPTPQKVVKKIQMTVCQ